MPNSLLSLKRAASLQAFGDGISYCAFKFLQSFHQSRSHDQFLLHAKLIVSLVSRFVPDLQIRSIDTANQIH